MGAERSRATGHDLQTLERGADLGQELRNLLLQLGDAGIIALDALHVELKGLGQAAWVGKSGGIIDVFDGHESIRILSPGTTAAKLEALEKKLL